MSSVVRNLSLGFPTRSDTNRAVQKQKIVRGLNISDLGSRRIALCGENKGNDQLRGYRTADLRFCFLIRKMHVFL